MMQSGDSTNIVVPIGTPLQIEAGGERGMVLPEVRIDENLTNEPASTMKQQTPRRKKATSQDGIVLTPDSVNHLVVSAKEETSDLLPSVRFSKEDTLASSFNLLNDESSLSDSVSPKDTVYTAKEKDGFSGLRPNLKVQQDSTFVLILICFALIVYAIKTEGEKMTRKIKNILTRNIVNREQTTMPLFAGLCLLAQTVLIFTLLILNVFSFKFAPYKLGNPIFTTFIIAVSIAAFIVIKMQISRVLEIVFSDRRLVKGMRRQHFTAIQLLGAFSFLPVLLYIYSEGMDAVLLSIIVGLFLLERIIAIYHVAFNFLQEKINFLFLIVYLCTVEILPYFVFYEIVSLIYKLDLTSILWH